MLVSKIVQIEFADTRIKAVDAIRDIRKAAEYASLNLYSRYGVQLQFPMVVDNAKVVVEIKIPEEIADTFALGNHLRGIASYLLRCCDGRYDDYVVGKRLLYYTEIPALQTGTYEVSMVDRLEAIAAFAKLLERNDEEATDQISRVLVILKESGELCR